ncbi:imelysin family protein [Pseudoalteromonas sp. JBTF-M23]|uniref:Imelysin family protein n=1 Tax=Pseudoalteromonas caenipelagi TaxID=2726988 RepID=A0A849VAV2_9GAMM|nr:imelysin family protein [Pseudoalteromonas caenipelagi]NOU50105.1 imelysin family protein [Pseudoalteromonas caenipelagi]
MLNTNKTAILLACVAIMSATSLSGCGGGSSDAKQVDNNQQNNNQQNNNNTGDNSSTQDKLTAEQGYEKLTTNLVDAVITPTYQHVHEQAIALQAQTIAFCADEQRDQNSLALLQTAWEKTNLAWQQARTIKLGPIAETFHYSRIQFWPISADKLASDVESLLVEQTDFSQGVAALKHQVQGLPAYEYIIYNTDMPLIGSTDFTKRCAYLSSIAENVDTMVINSINAWQADYGNAFKAGNGSFSSKKQALEKLLTIWFEYLEIVRDNKINDPLGLEIPGKIELVESVFSQTSVNNIKANVEALEKLYLGSEGFGFDDYLVQVNQREDVNTEISLHFKAVYDALDTTQYKPMKELIATNEGRAQLRALTTAIANLRSLMSSDFVQITGLAPGFNTNDGD